MSEDLRTAYEMEALIVRQHGLLIPSRCDCRFKVIASYPGHPWYFVHLACRHTLFKMAPNLNKPEEAPRTSRLCAWVTGAGEPVPISLLQKAHAASGLHPLVDLEAADYASITRSGGVYYIESEVLRYDEPR